MTIQNNNLTTNTHTTHIHICESQKLYVEANNS
jgi:hypothetical protein